MPIRGGGGEGTRYLFNDREKLYRNMYRCNYVLGNDTGLSLPSNWDRKSAPFPMAKSDGFSQFHVEKFPIVFTF